VAACADLAGTTVREMLTNRRPVSAHEELSRRHEALRLGGEAEPRLSRLVGRAGGLSALVRTCSEPTGKAVALFDPQERLVTSAGPVDEVRGRPVVRIPAGPPVPRTGEPREPLLIEVHAAGGVLSTETPAGAAPAQRASALRATANGEPWHSNR
jgi:hypothetical protein